MGDDTHNFIEDVRKMVMVKREEREEQEKALREAARNSLDEVRSKYEKQVVDLTYKIQDCEGKLETSQQNVNELRKQLDASNEEVKRLLEVTQRFEAKTMKYRREKIRRNHTMRSLRLETKLNEKTEELKIVNSTVYHLNETVSALTAKAEDLSAKLLAQSEESTRMMEYYKKELQANAKLVDLYKGEVEESRMETNELINALTEHNKLLSEASDQYGDLETKLKQIQVKHEQDLEEKNEYIHTNTIMQLLKDELKRAKDLLKVALEENFGNGDNGGGYEIEKAYEQEQDIDEGDATGERESATQSEESEQSQMEEGDIEEEGLDGVTSEGEKPGAGDESVEIEEVREAEASTSPSINTRSRSIRGAPSAKRTYKRRRGGRPTPII